MRRSLLVSLSSLVLMSWDGKGRSPEGSRNPSRRNPEREFRFSPAG